MSWHLVSGRPGRCARAGFLFLSTGHRYLHIYVLPRDSLIPAVYFHCSPARVACRLPSLATSLRCALARWDASWTIWSHAWHVHSLSTTPCVSAKLTRLPAASCWAAPPSLFSALVRLFAVIHHFTSATHSSSYTVPCFGAYHQAPQRAWTYTRFTIHYSALCLLFAHGRASTTHVVEIAVLLTWQPFRNPFTPCPRLSIHTDFLRRLHFTNSLCAVSSQFILCNNHLPANSPSFIKHFLDLLTIEGMGRNCGRGSS